MSVGRAAPGSDDALPELGRCLAEPGYTPPTRALGRLLRALGELPEEQATALERALVRAGRPALEAALAALPAAAPEVRPRLLSVLVRGLGAGALGAAPGHDLPDGLASALMAALDEPRAESRKLAARGLGKLGDARAEPRLLAALEGAAGPERKAIVDALGALGGAPSAERLAALRTDDAELARRGQRASLMIERRLGRTDADLRLDAPLGRPQRLRLRCRAGLGELLAEELAELPGRFRPVRRGPAGVDVLHAGTLGELSAARLALDVALVFELPAPDARPPEQRIASVLAGAAHEALARWTAGVPRFRVEWLGAGHRRALSWALAHALRERTTALVNDPRAARWTLRAPPDGVGELELVPRFAVDPRFAYRQADVPAASHPTLAAALARVAGVEQDEVVWDPFVGSGLELIERARLGAPRALWGSDLDARALAAARQNLEAAQVRGAELVQADALAFAPPAPSLIITNPPMGRRVARDGSLGQLLDDFLAHAARVLRPGGRLVWLSPLGERTERRARELGFGVRSGPDIDMGGFTARLQRLTRPT